MLSPYSFYQWAARFRLVMSEALGEDLMSVRRLAELRQVDKSRDNVMKKGEERQAVLFILYHSEKEASKLIVV